MSETRQGDPDAAWDSLELRTLFHQLNNQLGVALAHAELLAAKADHPADHARSTHVVSALLQALTIARAIRTRLESL